MRATHPSSTHSKRSMSATSFLSSLHPSGGGSVFLPFLDAQRANHFRQRLGHKSSRAVGKVSARVFHATSYFQYSARCRRGGMYLSLDSYHGPILLPPRQRQKSFEPQPGQSHPCGGGHHPNPASLWSDGERVISHPNMSVEIQLGECPKF